MASALSFAVAVALVLVIFTVVAESGNTKKPRAFSLQRAYNSVRRSLTRIADFFHRNHPPNTCSRKTRKTGEPEGNDPRKNGPKDPCNDCGLRYKGETVLPWQAVIANVQHGYDVEKLLHGTAIGPMLVLTIDETISNRKGILISWNGRTAYFNGVAIDTEYYMLLNISIQILIFCNDLPHLRVYFGEEDLMAITENTPHLQIADIVPHESMFTYGIRLVLLVMKNSINTNRLTARPICVPQTNFGFGAIQTLELYLVLTQWVENKDYTAEKGKKNGIRQHKEVYLQPGGNFNTGPDINPPTSEFEMHGLPGLLDKLNKGEKFPKKVPTGSAVMYLGKELPYFLFGIEFSHEGPTKGKPEHQEEEMHPKLCFLMMKSEAAHEWLKESAGGKNICLKKGKFEFLVV